MTDNTGDQHDPDQGGIVPPHILDKLDPTFSARRDPFYRRDHLAAFLTDGHWTDAVRARNLAEALISAGWVVSVAPRERE